MLTLQKLLKHADQYINEVQSLFLLPTEELMNRALVMQNKPERLTFFAPVYVSSACQSTCGYCAFRKGNKIKRRTLTEKEARQEVSYLKNEGYDVVYCLSGSFVEGDINKHGSMTEVNARGLNAIHQTGLFPILESSPFSKENFQSLIEVAGSNGRFVLFQECYDERTYKNLHGGDIYKSDPNNRLQQLDLALTAGWPEVGIGILIGLHPNVEQEIACLIAHYYWLCKKGAQKVTISVPRINNATDISVKRRAIDEAFFKVVYILRILCSQAEIVLTGRETSEVRDILRPVTHIWGVKGTTVPGGYTLEGRPENGQFLLEDRRSISELRRIYG